MPFQYGSFDPRSMLAHGMTPNPLFPAQQYSQLGPGPSPYHSPYQSPFVTPSHTPAQDFLRALGNLNFSNAAYNSRPQSSPSGRTTPLSGASQDPSGHIYGTSLRNSHGMPSPSGPTNPRAQRRSHSPSSRFPGGGAGGGRGGLTRRARDSPLRHAHINRPHSASASFNPRSRN